MHVEISERGFRFLMHPTYAESPVLVRLVSESSAIGDDEGAFDRPGSSFLWVGDNHHLNRAEVKALADMLQHWLISGRLPAPGQAVAHDERTGEVIVPPGDE